MTHDRLTVDLGARSYDIFIGHDVLGQAGQEIAALGAKRVFAVTDQNVGPLHLEALAFSCQKAGLAWQEPLLLPPGEQSKSFNQLEALQEELLAQKADRGTWLIALGGGVIGDLVGFSAATLLRGVNFVQVPTTLLAQVDSSVGGKTGINSSHGKNLIGAFHQPRLVLADTRVLSTLPKRELLSGYAEVAKYGLIDDAGFFHWLESHGHAVLEGEQEARIHAVRTSCAAKARIVAADEREGGQRALLNLGHTFGHALEAETGYSDSLLHGEAVAIGMVMAFELSAQLGLCPPEEVERMRRHLAAVGLPTDPHHIDGRVFSPQVLIDHMSRDKKVRDGKLTLVLTRGIGEAFLTSEVSAEELERFMALSLAA